MQHQDCLSILRLVPHRKADHVPQSLHHYAWNPSEHEDPTWDNKPHPWPAYSSPSLVPFHPCSPKPVALATFRLSNSPCSCIPRNSENFASFALEALFLPQFTPHPIPAYSSWLCLGLPSSRKPFLSLRLN